MPFESHLSRITEELQRDKILAEQQDLMTGKFLYIPQGPFYSGAMRETIGDLNCLVRPGESEGMNVVLLHGYGADNSDLFSLAEMLDPEGNWSFYFPNAPHEVPVGPGWTGRGWFPISLRELEVGIDFTQIRPPGLDESANLVSDLIFHLNSKKLILGGFSQGSMIATDVSLRQPEDIAGLVLYSPTMLDEKHWLTKASGMQSKKILLSHGTSDPVLPFSGAQRLYEMFKNAGAEIQMVSFSGGHEIPTPVLKKTKELLEQI